MVMQQMEDILRKESMLQAIYRKIIRSRIGYSPFHRKNIKKDLIIGFIGSRGGGKSSSAAVTSLVDFDLDGCQVFSNMQVGLDILVSEQNIRDFSSDFGYSMTGVPEGIYHFRTKPLDLARLLLFDPEYVGGCLLVDEINVEFSEARRSMSNTNLLSNRVVQELRHLQCSMLYTSLSEMYVDSRIRENTDGFCKCLDLANTPSGISTNKKTGEDFSWKGYYMDSCFNGESYYNTNKVAFEAVLHFTPWQGIHSTLQYQGQDMKKFGIDLKNASRKDILPGMDIKQAPAVDEFREKWGWLADLVEQYRNNGWVEVECEKFWRVAKINERGIYKNNLSKALKDYFSVKVIRHWDGPTPINYYAFDTTPGDEIDVDTTS